MPRPAELSHAAANLYDMLAHGGVADLRPTPASIIEEAPQCTVYRHRVPDERALRELPVLLVPPLAAPTLCFDLRRGCSLVEHLMACGHPTYLVDYGEIAFSDRELGLEHWVEDVLPRAIRAVADDAGNRPVQLVGWCLGGMLSLLAVAGDAELPVASAAVVASPFDFTHVRLLAPFRAVANTPGGRGVSLAYRLLGGAPAPLVKRAFQLSSIDKYLTKPVAMLGHLDDREFLAQIEATDRFVDNMYAYPGRTFGQLYHRFFRVNELAGGVAELSDRRIELADVRIPVLAIAGASDTLAPRPAVHALGELLPNAPALRLETCPGGHLGVLTGRSARDTTWTLLDGFLAGHAGAVEPPEHPPLRVVA